MNLRPHRRQMPEINLTPLLDVVFLLLIFFMVSTTFQDEWRLTIQLPQAQGQRVPDKEPTHLTLVIDQSGGYYVDDRAVVDRDPLTLVRALTGALGTRRDLPVLIKADANATHQAVMTALDALAELGLRRIAFSATRPGGKATGDAPSATDPVPQ